MARLPTPGSDDGTWGDILNAYLEVSLASDGTLNPNVVGTNQIQNNAVTNAKVSAAIQTSLTKADNAPTTLAADSDVNIAGVSNNQVLTYNSGTAKWIPSTVSSTVVSDATTGSKGIVQLAGDLGGAGTTAAAPLISAGAITDAKVSASAAIAKSKLAPLAIVDADVSAISESKITNLTNDLNATEKTANKDVASGYAGLDSNTLLKVSELPRAAGIVVPLGTVSGTVTCDLSAGIAFTATLTGNTTFQFSNWPASGLVEPEIYTVQDITGGHSITVTGVTWEPTGSPPTFSTAPNAVNIIPVASFNGGSNIYGITGLAGPTGATGSVGPGICTFSLPGALAITTGASRQYFESSFTISNVRASVGTAPVGSSIICDVKKNGTTIYTTSANRPTITAGTNTATANNPDITSISSGDYLTVDVVQVGSSTPGADLTVTVTVH